MSNFYLKVQQFDQLCYFELSWGQGQQIGVTLNYPDALNLKYQEWQRIYLRFYNTELRGRVAEIGSLTAPPVDWHARLVEAEAQLLYEFHHWLRHAELYEIRATIAQATKTDLFLTCNSLDLARLPWEVWEIGTEFALDSTKFWIVRTPLNRRGIIADVKQDHAPRKARILAILGDESNLNFAAEKQAIRSLNSLADVTFIGLQSQSSIAELKTKIVQAIASPSGWDILFFAGHSNETNLTGGELGIAPNTSLLLTEIEPALTIAKERGLQVAIFNSCKGLSIANKLIDLGISQVAVMREPIHNRVAEEFFLRFIQALAAYKDVHESLLTAAKHLKLEKNLTYPSAYLIPSLFRHPEADLFCLQPSGIKQLSQNLKPTRIEAIALLFILTISLLLPLQRWGLQRRILVQAIYRQLTNQIARVPDSPILLVQIDEASIIKANISNPKPMNRQYLASLVDALVANNARVIGIDYLLDRPQAQGDRILAESIQNAISAPQPTWFVLAATHNLKGEWLQALPNIVSLDWSLQGDIKILPWYMQLFPMDDWQSQPWHFSSLLTLSHELQQIPNSPQPQLDSQTDFLQQINAFLKDGNKTHQTIVSFPQSHLQAITALSYWLDQMWMHPIIDFSIPPQQIYRSIPAWQLLENPAGSQSLQQQIVMIAAGGYNEAGISEDGEDNFHRDLPPAVKYWRNQESSNHKNRLITGGEIHAYMAHHLLTRRLVVPIPDFWVICMAILLSKSLYLLPIKKQKFVQQWLVLPTVITTVYGLISLQIYISTAILLPWVLPSTTVWFYFILANFHRKKDA
ncbi:MULTISPECIES: CHASE2 domain-containing protein [unclassified Nodularia (in: cyanobacteria)]|uniref:CHASE2 domain-containing protein n=1 Tax=Nodularia sp. LEGE 04288 TaxID=1828639 RepID=UPI001D12E35D|nr:CHASE2 domain-containing protein [Nodularia sp. LEGE 06071]